MLAEHRPDIVLLDRVLPDLDGAEICKRIKSQPDLASIYVIMLSALKTTEDDRVSGLEAGADDYIVKPIGKRELLARIQVAVRLQKTQAELRVSEAKFRTLAENSPDIISRFDENFRYLYVTPAIETDDAPATRQLYWQIYLGTGQAAGASRTVARGFPGGLRPSQGQRARIQP